MVTKITVRGAAQRIISKKNLITHLHKIIMKHFSHLMMIISEDMTV